MAKDCSYSMPGKGGTILKNDQPTCTESGRMYYICDCGCGTEVETIKITPPLGHTYGEWATSQSATCTSAGSKFHVCQVCNYRENEEIPALGHNYQWTTVTAATCGVDGKKENKCTICGDVNGTEIILKTGEHHFEQYEGKDPTCTEEGWERYNCSVCNEYGTSKTISALGHDWDETQITDTPTCTEIGSGFHTCKRCGESEAVTIAKIPHQYEWVTVTQPSCELTGLKIYRCSVCETQVNQESIPATGHSYGGWTMTVTPDCTNKGSHYKTCKNCGDKVTEDIDALGHDWGYHKTLLAATCTEKGATVYACKCCDEPKEGSYVETDALGHDLLTEGDDPTCTEDGYKRETCQRDGCNYSKTTSLQALGHSVSSWAYIGPTCTTDGYYSGTCSECGATVNGSVDEGSAAHPQASLVDIPAVAATCSSKGSTWGQKCTACGVTIVQPVETEKDPSNHKEIPVSGKNATCTESGLTEGTKCEWCGTVIKVQEEIPASGHDWDDGKITTQPTATTDGVRTYTCSNCTDTYTEPIPATGGGDTKVYYSVTTNHYAKINGIDTFLNQDIFEVEAETWVNPEDYIRTYDKYEYNGNCTMTDPQPITENLTIDYYYQMKVISNSYTIEVGETISIDYDDSLPSIEVSAPNCVEYQLDSSVIMITGKKVGSGTIILKTAGEKFAEYNITVKAASVTKYTLTFQHRDADTEVIIWSNTSASLDKNTLITAATLDRYAEQIDNYTYQPSTIGSFTLLGDTKIDLYYKKNAEAPTYTISFKYINQDNVEIYTRDSIKSRPTTINPSTYAIDTIDYNNGKYRLVSTSPKAPFTLSADTTITYTYRGYYSATIRYINIKSGTSIKTEEIQYLSKQSFTLPASAPEISGYKALNYVMVNEDRQEALSKNKVISLENIDNYIDYQYTTDHIHNFIKDKTVLSSCTTSGYELYTCSCGAQEKRNITNALGHDWGEWIITVKPTPTVPGEKSHTCNRCKVTESEIIASTGVITEDIETITLKTNNGDDYLPTTTYDMIVVSENNTDKLINVGAAAPSMLSKGSIYIEGGISVKSNLNSGWLRRIKNGTDRRISPKTTVDFIVLNQDNAQAFIVKTSAPVGETQDPAGTLYFVIGE